MVRLQGTIQEVRRHARTCPGALCPQPQRKNAPGQSVFRPVGVAFGAREGGRHGPADGGSGSGPLSGGIRAPAGGRSALAGSGLGRGLWSGRSPWPVPAEGTHRAVCRGLSGAGSAGAGLSLLLHPGRASRGQRAPPLGRLGGLSGDLPDADAGGTGAARPYPQPGLAADGPRPDVGLYRRPPGELCGKPGPGLWGFHPPPVRRGVCLPAGSGGG